MRLHPSARRLTALLAAFAILLAALVPLAQSALAGGANGGLWTEICTAAGIRTMPADSLPHDEGQGFHAKHCPFCQFNAMPAVLPSGGAVLFAIAGRAPQSPHLFFHAPHPLFIWAGARSRAPPLPLHSRS